jgi:hypothetical protein
VYALRRLPTGSKFNPDCNLLAREASLPSGPVMAQEAEGFVQWPLPALRAAARLAGHLDVAAAGGCGSPALARSPGDEDRAWLPLMPKTGPVDSELAQPPGSRSFVSQASRGIR